jgi:hypothetical protein
LLKDGFYYAHAIAWAFVVKAKQKDTMMGAPASKDDFPEILIIGNDNAPFAHSPGQNIRVVSLRHGLSNGQYVMSEAAKIFYYRCTSRLIYDEMHGGYLIDDCKGKNVLVGQNLGCVGESCTEVIGLQPWIFPQDVTLWDALGNHAHN